MAEPIDRITYLGMPIEFCAKVRAHFGGSIRLSQCWCDFVGDVDAVGKQINPRVVSC